MKLTMSAMIVILITLKHLYKLSHDTIPGTHKCRVIVKTGHEVIKLFSCSTQLSMKFVLLINLKLLTIANSFLLNIAEHENIVGIFIFISRENFILS